MFQLPDPLTLFGLARLFEDVVIVAATGISMWSRNPSRREAARRLIRTLRRRPEVNAPQHPKSEAPQGNPPARPTSVEPTSRGTPNDNPA
jgi:hypothetical protein